MLARTINQRHDDHRQARKVKRKFLKLGSGAHELIQDLKRPLFRLRDQDAPLESGETMKALSLVE